jgi:hypothetical protein
MKLRDGLAALAVAALLLPSLRASAQTPDSSDEPAEDAKPDKPAKSVASEAPAEAAETPPPAPAPAAGSETGPYVPFAQPPSPLRIENSSASIQFGILAQPQFEMAGAPDADKTTKNIFLRRFRFMVGGTLFKSFEFFFQVDWPNLFKLDPGETMKFDKNAPGLNIQDAYATFKPLAPLGDRVTRSIDIKVDAGFMLPPLSHNSLESAAKLYGQDYFVNTYRRNVTNNADPFGAAGQSPLGRDTGAQLRVLALNSHIDFRGGVFMGKRLGAVPAGAGPAVVGGVNPFRLAARLQINLLDGEPGFFYQGTYLGAKKIVSIGGFVDYQNPYKYFGGDFFVDLPVGPGVFTAQADVGRWDGGTYTDTNGIIMAFLPMPKQTVYMAEVGYLIGPIMLSPIAHFERLVSPLIPMDSTMPNSPLIVDPMNPSEDRYGGGLAFWPYGHNSNLKAFFTRIHRAAGGHDFNVINVQWQVYVY